MAVGSFNLTSATVTAAANSGSIAALGAAFRQFGSSIPFGAGGSGGFYSANIGAVINNDAPANGGVLGRRIDIFAGNGDDPASSDQIFIFRSDKIFEADDPTFAATISLNGALAEGEVLAGEPRTIFVPLAGGEFAGATMVSVGGVAAPLEITEIRHDPDTGSLSISWKSRAGMLYNLRSSTDGTGNPASWQAVCPSPCIVATPPLNTFTIPLPADRTRLFVIEEVFRAP